ncbi:MAG TPA: polyribonucleotide nucleotidyltransferase [Planctomycetota bacterium]|nr:polyribonucleotide nucleotidyltransferase [Planctomycetota bacterium]
MIVKKSRQIGGKTLSIEVGKLARLAGGSAVVTLGESIVLATVDVAEARPGIDFFPLTVEYREKTYAAGKIPGGFFKREGRPTTKEILGCRLIDRPIRPLFADGFVKEVQVICNVLSYDGEHDPDVLAGIATSMAVMASGAPLRGPVGWARVGYIDGRLELWPADGRRAESALDLIVAGTKDSVTMVEAGAKELPEALMLDAVDMGHAACRELCALQDEVLKELGRQAGHLTYVAPEDASAEIKKIVNRECKDRVRRSIVQPTKPQRQAALDPIRKEMIEKYGDPDNTKAAGKWPVGAVKAAFTEVADTVLRELILEGKRVDGRGPTEIRPITCEISVLPRAHGSALFTRGETQALVASTLGTGLDEQIVDGLQEEYKKRFMLHYNFPPFSVGEVRPIRGTSRREIGHGNLAERALESVVPPEEPFPYTLRLVSEILMSNGSSSMATVCGGTLAMLDAGIKIKAPVAGIAMGLVKENGKVVILSDILGDEDHSGDMDFKVAGTPNGVTALQMDIKIAGVSRAIMEKALDQARAGRLHILNEMGKAIATPRDDYSPYAPRLIAIKINPEKIGAVIGPGGKVIRQIQEETGTTVEISDDGTVKVFAVDGDKAKAAIEMIEGITAEAEVGQIYEGKVVQMRDFGVFVQILPNLDGLVHVSELSDGYVERPEDVVKMGDTLRVKCIDVDPSGKVRLSRRAVILEERGEVFEPAPRGGGGGGGGGGGRGGRGRGPRDRGRDRGGERRGGERGGDYRGGDRGGRGDGGRGHHGGGGGGGQPDRGGGPGPNAPLREDADVPHAREARGDGDGPSSPMESEGGPPPA